MASDKFPQARSGNRSHNKPRGPGIALDDQYARGLMLRQYVGRKPRQKKVIPLARTSFEQKPIE